MKQILIITLLSLLVCGSALAQSGHSQILDKVRIGVTDKQRNPELRKAAPIQVEVFDENGRRTKGVVQNEWTEDTLDFLEVAFDNRLNERGVQLRPDKQSVILDHLDRYVAHKAILFSSYPPSEELAEVIAAQVVRGIEWANSSDHAYPPEAQRTHAREQIGEILDAIEAHLLELFAGLSIDDAISAQIDALRGLYDWRVDSPFYVHGKKVFSKADQANIVAEAKALCEEKADPSKIEVQ